MKEYEYYYIAISFDREPFKYLQDMCLSLNDGMILTRTKDINIARDFYTEKEAKQIAKTLHAYYNDDKMVIIKGTKQFVLDEVRFYEKTFKEAKNEIYT